MTDRSPTAYAYRDWSDVERVAREHFHVRTFRAGQRELIEAVLSGRDALIRDPLARVGGGRLDILGVEAMRQSTSLSNVSTIWRVGTASRSSGTNGRAAANAS